MEHRMTASTSLAIELSRRALNELGMRNGSLFLRGVDSTIEDQHTCGTVKLTYHFCNIPNMAFEVRVHLSKVEDLGWTLRDGNCNFRGTNFAVFRYADSYVVRNRHPRLQISGDLPIDLRSGTLNKLPDILQVDYWLHLASLRSTPADLRAAHFADAMHCADLTFLTQWGIVLVQRAGDDQKCWSFYVLDQVSQDWVGMTTPGCIYAASMLNPHRHDDEATMLRVAVILDGVLSFIVKSRVLANLENAHQCFVESTPALRRFFDYRLRGAE